MTLDKNLMPENAPVTSKRQISGYDFDTMADRGMVKRFSLGGAEITTENIANDAVTTAKIANLAVTTGKIANDAVTNVKIASFDWSKGTGGTIATGTILGVPYQEGTVTTSLITGGTINAPVVGTPNITGGTVGTAIIGTSSLIGGTVNAGTYQVDGTAGATGSIVYVKNLAPGDLGTVIFTRGLVTSIT